VEANNTGGQGSRRAVAPSDDDDDNFRLKLITLYGEFSYKISTLYSRQVLFVFN
jgi:hypothetical protein